MYKLASMSCNVSMVIMQSTMCIFFFTCEFASISIVIFV
jgi:hypothetical protein